MAPVCLVCITEDDVQQNLFFSGEALKEAREAAEMTQVELAAACGRTEQSISDYELGYSMPNVEVAMAMARAVRVDISDLFREDERVVLSSNLAFGWVGDAKKGKART